MTEPKVTFTAKVVYNGDMRYQKPRNPTVKVLHQKTGGGAHTDKRAADKRGYQKHKGAKNV